MNRSSLLDQLAGGPRPPYYVLDALDRGGGRLGWKNLKAETRLETAALRTAIHACNAKGWIAGRPTALDRRRLMEYSLTHLGHEILTAYRTGQVVILRVQAREIGLDRIPEYRKTNRFLFRHDLIGS